MKALVTPIFTGAINGRLVRFFRGPSGRPELPWHAVEDLYLAAGLPRDVRRQLLRLTQGSWSRELRTVATPDSVVTIAPRHVAQGLLAAFVETGRTPATLEAEYAQAGAAAPKALAGDLPAMAGVQFALAAFRNTNGNGGAS